MPKYNYGFTKLLWFQCFQGKLEFSNYHIYTVAGPFEYPFTANHGACSYDSYLYLFSMLLQHIFESAQTKRLAREAFDTKCPWQEANLSINMAIIIRSVTWLWYQVAIQGFWIAKCILKSLAALYALLQEDRKSVV